MKDNDHLERDRAEHELLLEMAAAFDGANEDGSCYFRGYEVYCICGCLWIAFPIQNDSPLFEIVKKKLPQTYGIFCWPVSKAGATERAKWCREEAKKLEGRQK